MKILFLAAYFPPEKTPSTYLIENRNQALIEAGFYLEVYAPLPSRGVSQKIRKFYLKNKKEKLYDGKLIIHRFFLYRERNNIALRLLRYLFCVLFHFLYGLFSKNNDVIFVASTPPIQGAMAALIKKIKKVPFIYNLQDIFPDSLVGTGLANKGGLVWKIGRSIENFTYRNADKIIVISEDFKRNIMAKGVPENKIEVIYNWVDQNIVTNIKREDNILFDRYNLNRDKFYVTYCGNIGLTQNMNMLLEVAKEMSEEQNIHFVLVGEGAYKKEVEHIIQQENIKNVTLLPFQPYEEISYVFSLGDVGVIISKPGVGENSVPSKTWSIMSAERPVIANFDENEIKTIIENNNCGLFTNAGDKEGFKDAILLFYEQKELKEKMGENGRKFIMNNLTKEIGTKKYVEVVKSLLKDTQ